MQKYRNLGKKTNVFPYICKFMCNFAARIGLYPFLIMYYCEHDNGKKRNKGLLVRP